MKLSEEQQKAIENVDGATLLLAVPGSGKTTTLITRIGRMIYELGIDPGKILVITYTRSAARDMRNRFSLLFGNQDADRIHFSTINSFCYSVVLRYARLTGHRKPEDDIDLEYNIRQLFPTVYGEQFPDENEIRNLAQQITYVKNMGLKDEEVEGLQSDDRDVKPMYDAYRAYLKEHHRMDYDDQILFTEMIFRNNLCGLRDEYADRYPYILLDEAQDTSRMQHEVIRLLAEKYGNIFMVGDEDQSIYGFRAAYPEALVDFQKLYHNGKVYYLQTNFRSVRSIVQAAANVICRNQNRYDKNMKSSRREQGQFRQLRFRNRAEQYPRICEELQSDPVETAILYRNHDSALPFISLFEKEDIPYRCREMNTLFFTNKVVRDALDIIDFAFHPASKNLIWKLYYKLDLRIRKKTLYDATKRINYREHHPILTALYRHKDLSTKQKKGISSLIEQLDLIRDRNNAREAIRRIRCHLGYKNASSEKLFILQAMTFDDETIPEFLERLKHLEQILRDGKTDPEARIILSTIHSSKGLEYSRVILVDAVEDILPNPESDLEEERRVFYVGITRAKDQLVLCSYGDFPGLFQSEVYEQQKPSERKKTRGQEKGKKKTGFSGTSRSRKDTRRDTGSAGTAASAAGFTPGALLKHRSFGTGRIVWLNDEEMIVDFGGKGKKTFLLSLVLENDIVKRI